MCERLSEETKCPKENQFYARDDKNEGTLICNGMLDEAADSVFLRSMPTSVSTRMKARNWRADKFYEFVVKLKPGLIKYRVEFGSKKGDRETVRHTADNLVCGDAYLIQGQSNAVATDWGEGEPTFTSPWIRSFGSMSGNPDGIRLWGDAVYRNRDAEKLADWILGYGVSAPSGRRAADSYLHHQWRRRRNPRRSASTEPRESH